MQLDITTEHMMFLVVVLLPMIIYLYTDHVAKAGYQRINLWLLIGKCRCTDEEYMAFYQAYHATRLARFGTLGLAIIFVICVYIFYQSSDSDLYYLAVGYIVTVYLLGQPMALIILCFWQMDFMRELKKMDQKEEDIF